MKNSLHKAFSTAAAASILLVIPLVAGGLFSLDTPRASAAAPVTDDGEQMYNQCTV